jgi:hypothetical protein
MRDFRPALGAVVLFLLLIVCANSDAGRRCRHAPCCDIPCWVRCWDYGYGCPPGTKCKCYEGGQWVDCAGHDCDPMTISCVKSGYPDSAPGDCGGACQGCAGIRLYAMMRDPCTGLARFARPCECPDGWLQLHYLCKPWPGMEK